MSSVIEVGDGILAMAAASQRALALSPPALRVRASAAREATLFSVAVGKLKSAKAPAAFCVAALLAEARAKSSVHSAALGVMGGGGDGLQLEEDGRALGRARASVGIGLDRRAGERALEVRKIGCHPDVPEGDVERSARGGIRLEGEARRDQRLDHRGQLGMRAVTGDEREREGRLRAHRGGRRGEVRRDHRDHVRTADPSEGEERAVDRQGVLARESLRQGGAARVALVLRVDDVPLGGGDVIGAQLRGGGRRAVFGGTAGSERQRRRGQRRENDGGKTHDRPRGKFRWYYLSPHVRRRGSRCVPPIAVRASEPWRGGDGAAVISC